MALARWMGCDLPLSGTMKDKHITVTKKQKELFEQLAKLSGLSWEQLFREKLGDDVTIDVVDAPNWNEIDHVVGASHRVFTSDERRVCATCGGDVFLHDRIPHDVTAICDLCAFSDEPEKRKKAPRR